VSLAVTSTIKNIIKRRDAEILSGQEAVIELLRDVRKQILAELISAPGDSFSSYRMKQVLSGVEKHLSDFESSATREIGGRLNATWAEGVELLPAVQQTADMATSFNHISTHTLDALKDFTFGKIKSVTGDLYDKIRGELALGILGQKTPAEVAAALAGQIANVPIPKDQWGNPYFKSAAERAWVITGVETGRAFSLATQKSMESAVDVLPELGKMWLHAGHPMQPRLHHLGLHGAVRKIDEPFYETKSGYGMQYPRDPNAPIGEVIRCGCTHIPYMTAWGDAKAFAADFDAKQTAANKPRGAYKQG
jgi:hypothetical protein